jgi:hypothetical protein
MGEQQNFGMGDWGSYVVRTFIHPFTIVATPVFVLILTAYFIINAFRISIYDGVRSFAAALFPLIIMTFIYIFNKDLIKYLEKVNILISFSSALIWGFIVMVVIRFSGSMNGAPIPISELVLSGSFAILIFSYVETAQS